MLAIKLHTRSLPPFVSLVRRRRPVFRGMLGRGLANIIVNVPDNWRSPRGAGGDGSVSARVHVDRDVRWPLHHCASFTKVLPSSALRMSRMNTIALSEASIVPSPISESGTGNMNSTPSLDTLTV